MKLRRMDILSKNRNTDCSGKVENVNNNRKRILTSDAQLTPIGRESIALAVNNYPF